jgi:hypothetical protein
MKRGSLPSAPKCPRCDKSVFAVEQVLFTPTRRFVQNVFLFNNGATGDGVQCALAQIMPDVRQLQKGAWSLELQWRLSLARAERIRLRGVQFHSPRYLCTPFQSVDSTNLCDKTLENGKQVGRPPNVLALLFHHQSHRLIGSVLQVLLRQGVWPERLWLWRWCWYTANDRCATVDFARAKSQHRN